VDDIGVREAAATLTFGRPAGPQWTGRALLARRAVDPFPQQIQVAAVPGGLLDHVNQRVPELERHALAARHVVEPGRRDRLTRAFTLGPVPGDDPG
jgi:hypothetical protein